MRLFRRKDRRHKGAVYWIEYRRHGRRYRRSLRVRDRSLAERLARRLLDAVDAGRWGLMSERKSNRELVDAYERFVLAKGSTLNHAAQQRRYLERALPLDRSPQDLTGEILVTILGRFEGRARTYLYDALRAYLRWCVTHDHIYRSPLGAIPRPKVERRRPPRRSLTEGEMRALLEAAPFERAITYLFLALSGLRCGEAAAIEWRDIRLEALELHVREETTKNGEKAILPIRKDLGEWLERWRREETRRLGAEPEASSAVVRVPSARTFYRDLAAAGIARSTPAGEVNLHALRVTWVTWLGEAGAGDLETQKLARHETAAMTYLYTRFGVEKLRKTVEGMRGRFAVPAQLRRSAAAWA